MAPAACTRQTDEFLRDQVPYFIQSESWLSEANILNPLDCNSVRGALQAAACWLLA